MTTADWALAISIISVSVSVAGFAWNVWSKFIFPKAQVRVSFSVNILLDHIDNNHEMLSLHAINYGPGQIILHLAVGRSRPSRFKRLRDFMLNPLHNFPTQLDSTLGPFSGGLPKKIDVGEGHSAFFVLRHAALRDQNVVDVGFTDTFGRNHWAPRKQVRKVRKAVIEAFKSDR